jgi:hypothetical protein
MKTPNQLRPLTEEISLNWHNWVSTRICPEKGQISPVELKIQRSYCSPDMSSQGLDMSGKPLWNPVKGLNKSGGPNLFWNRSNRFDRYERFQHTLEFGFLSSLLESLWVLITLVLSRSPCCILLHSTTTYTQEINKTQRETWFFFELHFILV